MTSNISYLYTIGKNLLTQYQLDKKRIEFEYDFEINNDESDDKIREFITTKFNISNEQIKNMIIIHKTINENGLKWHIDDCQIIKRASPPTTNIDKFIKIDENKYLYFNTPKLPIFTILFYSSTYNEDFTGGILNFVDKEIFPKKGNGILFDSREVHMVTPVKSGIRKVTLVKIY
jgi:hypothetical protein